MKVVDATIFATLSGDSALMALATGGVFHQTAPQDANRPNLVWWTQSSTDEWTYEVLAAQHIILTLRADGDSAQEFPTLSDILDRANALLNNQPLVFTGYNLIGLRRSQGPFDTSALNNGVYYPALTSLYRLDLQPTS